jgi:hypothetical protein
MRRWKMTKTVAQVERAIAALPAGTAMTRAMRNRLEKLAVHQQAVDENKKERALYEALVERGFATRETQSKEVVRGIYYTWDIFYITDAGREALKR